MRGFDFLLVGRFFDFYDHFLKVEIFKIKINLTIKLKIKKKPQPQAQEFILEVELHFL